MKRSYLILTLLLLLAVTATSVMAQQRGDKDGDGVPDSRDQCPDTAGSPDNNGCPVFEIAPPQPPPPTDSDGDGLPDSDDQCPNQAGPRENGGCPVTVIATLVPPPSGDVPDQPPADPRPPGEPTGNPGDLAPSPLLPTATLTPPPPPFQPPLLPIDGCYVTPASSNSVNVRKAPEMGAETIGSLMPGVVYEAQGVLTNGSGETWYQLVNYQGSTGTPGFSAGIVLNATVDCAEIDLPGNGTIPNSMEDFVEVSVSLCDMSVGWDAPTWSTSEPQGESVVDMALWFAAEPGAEIPAGTNALGVIYLRGGVDLPDAENIVAVMTDPVVLDAALNSDTPVDYGYPAAAHGVQSGEIIFYRLTDDIGQVGDGTGNCGPIVADIDGFASTAGSGPFWDEPTCYYDQNGGLQVCGCPASDGECLAVLITECTILGGQLDLGPENSACWYDERITPEPSVADLVLETPVPGVVVDDFAVSTPDVGILEGRPQCDENFESCSCSVTDYTCITELVAGCQGEGDQIEYPGGVIKCNFGNTGSGGDDSNDD
jgi:hypothetical protein